MIHARYSFGYIGAVLICAHHDLTTRTFADGFFSIAAANIVTFMGFLILNVILGGQALSSASSGGLSWNVGIVIIALISLFVRASSMTHHVIHILLTSYQLTFCGYRVLTAYEKYAWMPVITVFIIAAGVGGKHLENPVCSYTSVSFSDANRCCPRSLHWRPQRLPRYFRMRPLSQDLSSPGPLLQPTTPSTCQAVFRKSKYSLMRILDFSSRSACSR